MLRITSNTQIQKAKHRMNDVAAKQKALCEYLNRVAEQEAKRSAFRKELKWL